MTENGNRNNRNTISLSVCFSRHQWVCPWLATKQLSTRCRRKPKPWRRILRTVPQLPAPTMRCHKLSTRQVKDIMLLPTCWGSKRVEVKEWWSLASRASFWSQKVPTAPTVPRSAFTTGEVPYLSYASFRGMYIYVYIYINMFFFTSWNIGVQWFNFKNIPFGHAHAGQHGPAIVQIFTTMHVLRTTEETPLSNLMGSLNLSSYYVHKQVGTAETERASSLEHRMEFRHNYCE